MYAQEIAEQATAVIGWINLHSRVRVVFDSVQIEMGRTVPLAYLVACITRWTTHFTAFARLYELNNVLKQTVAFRRRLIVDAQVGAAKYADKERLTANANEHCDIIASDAFWNGLEQVLGDIEVICFATNLGQKDSARADQVLLALVGIYLRFAEHPEPSVKIEMLRRIEKRWTDCDQPLFLLCLVLNPWEQLSCFGNDANLDHFKVMDIATQVSRTG